MTDPSIVRIMGLKSSSDASTCFSVSDGGVTLEVVPPAGAELISESPLLPLVDRSTLPWKPLP